MLNPFARFFIQDDISGPGLRVFLWLWVRVGLSHKHEVCVSHFKPEELEYLSINLRLDAFIIKDSFSIRWTSETGMVDNMESIVEEYKNTRQLLVSVQVHQMKNLMLLFTVTLENLLSESEVPEVIRDVPILILLSHCLIIIRLE